MIQNIKIEYSDGINPNIQIENDAKNVANKLLSDFILRINEENALLHIFIVKDKDYRFHFSKISDDLLHEISKRASIDK